MSADTVYVSSIVLPAASEVSGVVTQQAASGFNQLNFELTSPDTDQYACASQTCPTGQMASFGAFPAGTSLVFYIYGYVFGNPGPSGSSSGSGADIIQDNPDEWTIIFDGGDINIYATSVSPQNTMGSPPLGVTNNTQCRTPKPVNCATGNFTHTFTDLAVPGRGIPLHLTRTYNSLAASSEGIFGYGWTSSYEMSLSFDDAGDATVNEPGGAQATFFNQGSGQFSAPAQVLGTLVQNSDGTYTLTQRGQETFSFSSTGQLTAETDLNGYATTLAYNPAGQLTTVTDPAGRTLSFSYGSNGLVSSVVDPAGRTVSYSYDSAGELTSVTDVNGGTTTFAYDGSHELLTMTGPRNDGSLTNTYNSSGQVTQQVDAMGRTTTFSYGTPSSSGVETNTIISPNGDVTSETYTAGMLTSITRGVGTSSAATTAYTYDPTLGVTSITDPDGHVWTATYDSNGNQTQTTDPDGNTTTEAYNAFDEPTSITDADGNTTTLSYDADGNLDSVARTLAPTSQTQATTYTYGDSAHPGDLTAMTDPDGHQTTFTYDSDGDLTSTTDPSGNQTTYGYSCTGGASTGCYPHIGLLYTEVKPRGNAAGATPANFTTSYAYNALSEVTSQTDPLGDVTSYSYDDDGNLTAVTYAVNTTTAYQYDADDELTKITRPDGTTIQYGYDDDGNVTSQTNGAGHATTYQYDPLDRVTSVTDPLSETTSYTYDGSGNELTAVDPEGRTTTFGYDNADRLTAISYSDTITPNVTFAYNGDGEQTSMTDGTGTTTDSYDSLSRLTAQTNGDGQQVAYRYDLADNLTSLTYPNGQSITRGFNADEQLTSVTDWLGNTTTFAYDPDSDLQSTTFPSATSDVDTNSYDDADQLSGVKMAHGSSNLALISYLRDGDGRVTSESDQELPQPSTAVAQAYAYDNADDPTELRGTPGYSYNVADELTSSPSATYSYDTLGERTALTPSSGAPTGYAYNQAGQLTTYTPPTGSTTSYTYDGNGVRASKTTGSNTSQFAWDESGAQPLLLTDTANSYIYGPTNTPIEQISSSGTPSYLYQDQLGSTRLITNQSGTTTGSFTYSPYGTVTASSGSATTPFGYAGQYTDTESGLLYDQARYYDPTTGQFISNDPLEAVTGQPYSYAGDDPVNDTDPTGLLTVGRASGILCRRV